MINLIKSKLDNNHLIIYLNYIFVLISFSIAFGYQYTNKLIPIMIVLWLIVIKKEQLKYIFLENKVIMSITIFMLYMFFMLFFSNEFVEGFKYIERFYMFLFFPLIIIVTTLEASFISKIIVSFLFGMFINELISYGLYFDLFNTPYNIKHNSNVGFLNHTYYSILVSFTIFLIFYSISELKSYKLKIIYFIFFVTMTINLLISGGRTGYFVYFGVLFFLIITYYKPTLKNILKFLIFPIILLSIMISFNDIAKQRLIHIKHDINKIVNQESYNSSTGVRIASYVIAYNWLKNGENIIFGEGTNDITSTFQTTIDMMNRKESMKINYNISHAHSYYVDVILSLGIVGMVIILYFLYSIYTLKIKDNQIRFIQKLIIPVILISSLSAKPLHWKETMVFFALFTAIIVWKSIDEENKVISQ